MYLLSKYEILLWKPQSPTINNILAYIKENIKEIFKFYWRTYIFIIYFYSYISFIQKEVINIFSHIFIKQKTYLPKSQRKLAEHIIYPDFTLRHPDTGKYYYWEHFGQMDTPEYYTKACSKMQLYISHGYISKASVYPHNTL